MSHYIISYHINSSESDSNHNPDFVFPIHPSPFTLHPFLPSTPTPKQTLLPFPFLSITFPPLIFQPPKWPETSNPHIMTRRRLGLVVLRGREVREGESGCFLLLFSFSLVRRGWSEWVSEWVWARYLCGCGEREGDEDGNGNGRRRGGGDDVVRVKLQTTRCCAICMRMCVLI